MHKKWRGEILIKNAADSEVLLSPGELQCEVKAIYDQDDLYTMSNLVTGKNIVKWAKVSNIEVEIGSGCELTKKQASVAVNRVKLSDAQLGKKHMMKEEDSIEEDDLGLDLDAKDASCIPDMIPWVDICLLYTSDAADE